MKPALFPCLIMAIVLVTLSVIVYKTSSGKSIPKNLNM